MVETLALTVPTAILTGQARSKHGNRTRSLAQAATVPRNQKGTPPAPAGVGGSALLARVRVEGPPLPPVLALVAVPEPPLS